CGDQYSHNHTGLKQLHHLLTFFKVAYTYYMGKKKRIVTQKRAGNYSRLFYNPVFLCTWPNHGAEFRALLAYYFYNCFSTEVWEWDICQI
ncbi:hypothetical protein, partial [Heliobacterium chlorum]|uniref:hypothetical protein n=1 Tax=Heliobacterium chlorum TaxID=2698 RepID=UPI001A9C22DE